MLWLILATLLFGEVTSLNNGLGRTPPMGWLSWQRFRCNIDCTNDPDFCISEKLFMQMADRLAADGYKKLGYEYVNIDDCWAAKERDKDLKLQADPVRFPSGIKALADYVHSKGLKLGIYADFGTHTCGGYPGTEFYMSIDAQTFADWGVDMLKLDGCYSQTADMPVGYPLMERFLNATGRPMLYSCSWPAYITSKTPDYQAIADSCNIWRNYNDISDSWNSVKQIIEFVGSDKGNFSKVVGPGNFNDPDMLIIGDYGLSYEQQRAQMAMWAIMAAPLLMSNDLRHIRQESKDILQNQRVIEVNQDPLGIMGKRIIQLGSVEIWTRDIEPPGSKAFAFLYTGSGGTPINVTVAFVEMDLTVRRGYNVTEVFSGKYLGVFKPQDTISVKVPPSGVFLGKAWKS